MVAVRTRLLGAAALVALLLFGASGCAAIDGVVGKLGGAAGNVAVDYGSTHDATYPSITPTAARGTQAVKIAWTFEGEPTAVEFTVDTAVLEGARSADKSASIPADWQPSDWEPGYYRAFESDPALDGFYAHLLTSLERVRSQRALDADRYAELIISMVQSLEYQTDNKPPKFPVETAADLAGDCDDKVILAAGLLSRAGYEVSLLSFDAESHMALGIGTNGSTFSSTGLAMVELTVDSMVGWYNAPGAAKTPSGNPIGTVPLTISIGTGASVYGAGAQVDKIRTAFDRANDTVDKLEPKIDQAKAKVDSLESQVASLDQQLNELAAAGDIEKYNSLVADYKALVGRYQAAVDSYNGLVVEQRTAATRFNDILGGQSDRVGVAEALGL